MCFNFYDIFMGTLAVALGGAAGLFVITLPFVLYGKFVEKKKK